MSNMGRIKKIKARVKNFLDFNDAQLLQWWRTPNAVFDGKTPEMLSKTPEGLKKLDQIVCFSTVPLDQKSDKSSKTDPTQRDQMSFDMD